MKKDIAKNDGLRIDLPRLPYQFPRCTPHLFKTEGVMTDSAPVSTSDDGGGNYDPFEGGGGDNTGGD
ncbi:MAG: hypothetical protein IKF77_04865 [Thermoguttaceae bacterium]|nr:hypothetical protein [Thermoguttaceae bacterium]MBR3219232.1 hypothetical protein [Thermoguttaceae bacterium]